MTFDRFDKLHLLTALLLLLGLFAVIADQGGWSAAEKGSRSSSVERALKEQARAAFLQQSFGPVEALIAAERYGEAAVQLQQLKQRFPGEPHALILQGELLTAQNVWSEAVMRYAEAIRLNGDYVDKNSPLSRRHQVEQLLEVVVPLFRQALQGGENRSVDRALKQAFYLQSRLAGGCE